MPQVILIDDDDCFFVNAQFQQSSIFVGKRFRAVEYHQDSIRFLEMSSRKIDADFFYLVIRFPDSSSIPKDYGQTSEIDRFLDHVSSRPRHRRDDYPFFSK